MPGPGTRPPAPLNDPVAPLLSDRRPTPPDKPPAAVARSASKRPAARSNAASPNPIALASAVRNAILEEIAERCPTGWRGLVLSPPPHPGQMTWHVHVRTTVALDLADGRTVPAAPPPTSDEWTLPSGRRAGLASGDLSPAPTQETRAVRVAGPYLSVTYRARDAPPFVVRVGTEPRRRHEYRAAIDRSQLSSTLAEGLRKALGARSDGATAMGYSPASWGAHERAWIEVQRR